MRWSTRNETFRVVCLALCLNGVIAQNLEDGRVALVRDRLAEAAQQSWELGTRAQTLLEIDAPEWSVFSRNNLPPPSQVPSAAQTSLAPVFTLVQEIVANRSRLNDNAAGPQPFMPDGSAADPASNGVAVLLANWTGQGTGGQDYIGAARDQLEFLLERVPKTEDGAISHRVSEVQLWSDFVYMVPPFLAYYGVLTRNDSLVTEAYNQIKLYRQYLLDTSANNLWKHVLLGTAGHDEGHWATGNAWAAAGMLRVLATIQNSEYDKPYAKMQGDLAHWVAEIHEAMYPLLNSTSNLFTNYPDRNLTSQGNFEDAASTALLASTVYRVSLYWGDHTHIPFAQRCRAAIYADQGNASHIDAQGWLTPVVNPHSYGVEGRHSAEGQAFILLMEAAYRDWVAEGSQGANASRRGVMGVGGGFSALVWGMLMGVGFLVVLI